MKLTLNSDSARIFDEENITWGQMDVTPIEDEQPQESYLYIATDLIVKFP